MGVVYLVLVFSVVTFNLLIYFVQNSNFRRVDSNCYDVRYHIYEMQHDKDKHSGV